LRTAHTVGRLNPAALLIVAFVSPSRCIRRMTRMDVASERAES
jgi:adenylylsulfate kinase-like enzyme